MRGLVGLALVLQACVVQEDRPAGPGEMLRLRGAHTRVWQQDQVVLTLDATEMTVAGDRVLATGAVLQTRQGTLHTGRLEFDQRTTSARATGVVEADVGPWHFWGSEVTFSRDARVSSAAPFALKAGPLVHYEGRAFQWDPVGAVAELSRVSSVVEAKGAPMRFVADRVVYREAQAEAEAQGHVTLGDREGARGVVRFVRGAEGQQVESSSVD